MKVTIKGNEFGTAGKEFVFKNADGSVNNMFEPSAIEALDEKYVLVADDKTANLSVVERVNCKIVKSLPIPQFVIGKPKWEGMAHDGEVFYIIGSHAVKLDDSIDKLTKKLAARSHLLRFKIKNLGEDASTVEIDSATEFNVTDSLTKLGLYNSDPNHNKVKIEGMTVFDGPDQKRLLLFALREPHDLMWIYSAEVDAMAEPNEKLTLKPFFSFEAGKIGNIPFRLSSIEYVQKLDGFLIVTSTEDDGNAFYGNALWFVSRNGLVDLQPSTPVAAQLIWLFDVSMKAEGLCVLPQTDSENVHVAFVYDNDAEDTNKPGMMRIVEIETESMLFLG